MCGRRPQGYSELRARSSRLTSVSTRQFEGVELCSTRGAGRLELQVKRNHVGLHVRRREPSALADLRSVFGEAKNRNASSR